MVMPFTAGSLAATEKARWCHWKGTKQKCDMASVD
jgi:hypothetical protein